MVLPSGSATEAYLTPPPTSSTGLTDTPRRTNSVRAASMSATTRCKALTVPGAMPSYAGSPVPIPREHGRARRGQLHDSHAFGRYPHATDGAEGTAISWRVLEPKQLSSAVDVLERLLADRSRIVQV